MKNPIQHHSNWKSKTSAFVGQSNLHKWECQYKCFVCLQKKTHVKGTTFIDFFLVWKKEQNLYRKRRNFYLTLIDSPSGLFWSLATREKRFFYIFMADERDRTRFDEFDDKYRKSCFGCNYVKFRSLLFFICYVLNLWLFSQNFLVFSLFLVVYLNEKKTNFASYISYLEQPHLPYNYNYFTI